MGLNSVTSQECFVSTTPMFYFALYVIKNSSIHLTIHASVQYFINEFIHSLEPRLCGLLLMVQHLYKELLKLSHTERQVTVNDAR